LRADFFSDHWAIADTTKPGETSCSAITTDSTRIIGLRTLKEAGGIMNNNVRTHQRHNAKRRENQKCYQSVLQGLKFSQITLEIPEQCSGFFLTLRWNRPFFSRYVGNHTGCDIQPILRRENTEFLA
jgi:hypothetical protein